MSPEQLWDTILAQLQLQMTRSTFDQWLQGTWLMTVTEDTWQVAVRNEAARQWLETRLRDTVQRVVDSLTNRPVNLQFIVPPGTNGHAPDTADAREWVTERDLWQPDGSASPFVAPLKRLNAKTGYYPLPHFYLEFWEPYLVCRWKQAGRRAFVLRQKLLSQDPRKIQSDNFTPWTPVIDTTFEALGQLINVNRSVISGRLGHCQQYERDRDLGQRRGDDCCGRHLAAGCRIERASRGDKRHCYFWRPGVLEVLSREKMVVIEQHGRQRYHKLRLQVFHQLPAALTPFQAAFLPDGLQQRHQQWLIKHAATFGWSLAQWQATAADLETFAVLDPQWSASPARLLAGRFEPNPYLKTSNMSCDILDPP